MSEEKKEKLDKTQQQNEQIEEMGQVLLEENEKEYHNPTLSIIGEVEVYECLPNNSKTTKYEHVLPKLAMIEDSKENRWSFDFIKHGGRRCRGRTCYCRDDCIFK